MNTRLLAATAVATALLLTAPSIANDSSAAIGLGGLELTQNAAISMDSEDLFLSRDLVTVKYRFTNTSDKDVETLVSFPLPPIPNGIDGYLGDQAFPDWNTLEFKTLVDGQPVKLELRDEVGLIGKPDANGVEKRLKELGWPLRHWDDYLFEQKLQDLSEAERKAYLAEGLLRQDEGADYVLPNWQVTTHVTRMQNFPAGKTISVEHSYKPVAGGSVGGALIAEYRKDAEYFGEYAARYCMDKPFLAGFDKMFAARQKAAKAKGDEYGGVAFVEHWLSYVLKSGANWKGPIKDFRLVVDKGKAENLVSFCADGVKKIAPTQFEVRKTDFEPQKDLDILIVEFYDFEEN
jgi:Domain of unknown function (DUF4424)